MVVEQRWLFVNKTSKSKSLSRSNGTETAHIFSHAQRGSRLSNDTAQQRKAQSRRAANTTERAREEHGYSSLKAMIAPGTNAVAAGEPAPLRPRPSLREICISSFDVFPMQYYLDLVFSAMSNLSRPLVLPTRSMQRSVLTQINALASTDSLIAGAILCTIMTSLQQLEFCHENAVAAMTMKSVTIRHLQARLDSTQSCFKLAESMGLAAYAISLLLWVECVEGNLEEAEAHLSGLEYLGSRVELGSIPPSMLSNIIGCSYLCCALLRRLPRLLPRLNVGTDTRKLYLHPSTQITSPVAILFEEPLIAATLGPKLTNIILQQRNILLFRNWCTHNEDCIPTTILEDSMCMILETKLNCWHALLDIICDVNVSPWQEAVAAAMFTIDQPLASTLRSSSACFQVIGDRIMCALKEIEVDQEQVPLKKLRLWLLVVAAYFSSPGPQFPDLVVKEFPQICCSLGLRTLKDLRGLLREFFDHMTEIYCTIEALWLGLFRKKDLGIEEKVLKSYLGTGL